MKCGELILAYVMYRQEGLAVASIARDDPSPLPGMHRDHNALPSQTDKQTDRQTDRRTLTSYKREMHILHLALKNAM